MEKEEVLKKVSEKKAVIGEMEKTKINSGNWIAVIVTLTFAVAMIITEGVLGHFSAIYAIAGVCYLWASTFYFIQFFKARRPWPVLIGAVLHGLAFITMIVLYILYNVGVI